MIRILLLAALLCFSHAKPFRFPGPRPHKTHFPGSEFPVALSKYFPVIISHGPLYIGAHHKGVSGMQCDPEEAPHFHPYPAHNVLQSNVPNAGKTKEKDPREQLFAVDDSEVEMGPEIDRSPMSMSQDPQVQLGQSLQMGIAQGPETPNPNSQVRKPPTGTGVPRVLSNSSSKGESLQNAQPNERPCTEDGMNVPPKQQQKQKPFSVLQKTVMGMELPKKAKYLSQNSVKEVIGRKK